MLRKSVSDRKKLKVQFETVGSYPALSKLANGTLLSHDLGVRYCTGPVLGPSLVRKIYRGHNIN